MTDIPIRDRYAKWHSAVRAWSRDDCADNIATMKLGEAMMYAATDLICALEEVIAEKFDREAMARIIDEDAWRRADACPVGGGDVWTAVSLAKADRILGLPATKA